MNAYKHRVTSVIDDVNLIDPPIDFSFLGLTSPPEDALDEMPRVRNMSLKKGETRKFKSNTLHLNNNSLQDLNGLSKLLDNFFVSPKSIQWINLSFNRFNSIPNEILELNQLQIIYLHANYIANMQEIAKLQSFKCLRSLTLHGNPIEKEANYRTNIIILLPLLRSLDFSDITSSEVFVAENTAITNARIQKRKNRQSYD